MKEIRVLLVGRTGHGKSSVGNTLLGRRHFEVSDRSQSCTENCTFGEQEFPRDDIRLVVVDTPGIFDTNIPKLQIMKELLKTVLFTTPGFHIIAFVLSPERFTPEMQQTQQLFFEWFGGNVRDYSCLIMTHCSSQVDVQRYIQNPHPSLQALIQGCNDKILPFENCGTHDLKQEQVGQFLNHALNIQANNGGQCFTNLAYHIATEYAKNRDLNTITTGSIKVLQDSGLRFMQDSMQSLKIIDETNEQGNLNIIYEGEQDPPGAVDVIYTRTDTCTPLTNFAADFEMSSDASSPPLQRKPQKPSSRANRVFVHPKSNTGDTAASTFVDFHRPDGAAKTPGTTVSPHGHDGHRGPDYGAIPKAKTGDIRYTNKQEGLARPRNRAEDMDTFVVNIGGAPASARSHTVAPSVASIDPGGQGESLRYRSTSRSSLITASDDLRDFRNDMRDEENVNKFIAFFRWVGRKLRQFLRCLVCAS